MKRAITLFAALLFAAGASAQSATQSGVQSATLSDVQPAAQSGSCAGAADSLSGHPAVSATPAVSTVSAAPACGTKISILGDSYSTYEGYVSPAENACWYGDGYELENDVASVDACWWRLLATEHGLTIERNNSYSGSTVCYTGYDGADYSDRAFITRMTDLGDPDVILVFGGTNDSWAGAPVGEDRYADWTPESLYAFRPAFCRLLDYLLSAHPRARIFNIVNSELSPEITGAMTEICRRYGVPNIQLHDIEKQWGHPSVAGMRSICDQVWSAMAVAGE